MTSEYYSQEGMEAEAREWVRFFREDLMGTVASRVPLYLHEVSFQEHSMTIYLDPTPWMGDRAGYMSNGAFAVALDQTMGILCLYATHKVMTPTVTMQLSLLRPIPLDRRLYIRAELMGTDGTKIDVVATAWSEGMRDQPACSAVGIYYHSDAHPPLERDKPQ